MRDRKCQRGQSEGDIERELQGDRARERETKREYRQTQSDIDT